MALGRALGLASAGIHRLAHAAIQSLGNRDAFVRWMLRWDALLFTPARLVPWQPFPAAAWTSILLSPGVEATSASIGKACRGGDLPAESPLARGCAVVFLWFRSVALLHEQWTRGVVGGVWG